MEGMFFANFIRESEEPEEILFKASADGSAEAEFSFVEKETPVFTFGNFSCY